MLIFTKQQSALKVYQLKVIVKVRLKSQGFSYPRGCHVYIHHKNSKLFKYLCPIIGKELIFTQQIQKRNNILEY